MERKLFEELTRSVRQAAAIARGERKASRRSELTRSRIQAVREKTELSQAQLARLRNVGVNTLQNREKASRQPTGPAKTLLLMVEKETAIALRTLMGSDAA